MSLTTRLGLEKPDPTDAYDIQVINDNMDILDLTGGVILCTSTTRPSTNLFYGMQIYETDTSLSYVWRQGTPDFWYQVTSPGVITFCTSTTRPASPRTGLQIYETDTGQTYAWNGTIWLRVTPGTVGGKRYVTVQTLATLTAGTAGTEALVNMDTGSVPVEANRLYQIEALVEWQSTIANDRVLFRIRQTNLAGGIWGGMETPPNRAVNVRQQCLVTGVVRASANGNLAFVLTAQRVAGTGAISTYGSSTFWPYMKVDLLGSQSQMQEI